MLGDIAKLAGSGEILVADFINCVKQLQSALTKAGYSGIVIVIDELGKFLEYEARHYGANDIFLLQALAEHACAGRTAICCSLLPCINLLSSTQGLGRASASRVGQSRTAVLRKYPFWSPRAGAPSCGAPSLTICKAQQKSIAASAQSAATALADAVRYPRVWVPKSAGFVRKLLSLSPVAALVPTPVPKGSAERENAI